MTRTILASVLIAVTAGAAGVTPGLAGFGDSEQQRDERWNDLQKQIFGEKKVTTDDKLIQLDAPGRAEDAALVPITIKLADPKDVRALYPRH